MNIRLTKDGIYLPEQALSVPTPPTNSTAIYSTSSNIQVKSDTGGVSSLGPNEPVTFINSGTLTTTVSQIDVDISMSSSYDFLVFEMLILNNATTNRNVFIRFDSDSGINYTDAVSRRQITGTLERVVGNQANSDYWNSEASLFTLIITHAEEITLSTTVSYRVSSGVNVGELVTGSHFNKVNADETMNVYLDIGDFVSGTTWVLWGLDRYVPIA